MNRVFGAFLTYTVLNLICFSVQGKVPTINVEDVRKGMRGYGMTVFSGTEPEKFDVEVIDVVPNFMLRKSIILIKCFHPETDKAGIIGGMSGSPIYLEGKLAGALAYGWRFSKEPLAGVTPIKNMYELTNRKFRQEKKIVHSHQPLFENPIASLKEKVTNTFFNRLANSKESGFVPVRTPLSLSGFGGLAEEVLREGLLPYGVEPVSGGGGTGKGSSGPKTFVEGSAIGVQIISGDLSATGIGTVTTRKNGSILAFGHPMFDMGENFLPATTARIHTVVSSLARSNKIGSPIEVKGALVQDRQAGIAVREDLRARMIPVEFKVSDRYSGVESIYNVQVADRHRLTGRLIQASLIQMVSHVASDVTDVVAIIEGRIKIKGRSVYKIEDTSISRTGLAPLVMNLLPAAIVQAVLNNPFEDAQIEWIEFDVKLDYGIPFSEIKGAYMTTESPRPGETVNLHVRVLDYGTVERIVTIPITIPPNVHGQKIKLLVGGGRDLIPPIAEPESLDDLLFALSLLYPTNSIVVQLEMEEQGLSLRGRTLQNLPTSVVSSLKPQIGDDSIRNFKTKKVSVIETTSIISGKKTIDFTVGKRN